MEKQSSNRVNAIELMKVIATVGMILVHIAEPTFIMIMYNRGIEQYDTAPEFFIISIIEILGGVFSAGAFMFAMGWGAAYSDKATVGSYLKRALFLYVMGVFINVFTGFYICYTCPDYFEIGSLTDCLYMIFKADIYALAALGMLVFAVMKKLNRVKSKLIFTAVLIVVSTAINVLFPQGTLATGNVWFDTIFVGLFTRQNDKSFFPFASWGVFILLGYWAGYCYRNTKNKKKFFIRAFIVAATLFALGQSVVNGNNMDPSALNPALANSDTYYGMNIWNVMSGCGLVLGDMLICFGIMRLTRDRLPNFMLCMSKNILYVYIVQWIIISLLYKNIIYLPTLWMSILMSFVILVYAYWIAIFLRGIVDGFEKGKGKL